LPIELRELASLPEIVSIEPEWRELWIRDPRATPFQSPDWLLPWSQYLWGGGQIRTLALYRDDTLAGLAPFFRWGLGPFCLSFLGSGITDYLDVLAEPDFAEEVARRIFDWLATQSRDCDWIDLQELRPDSPLISVAGGHWRKESCAACPVLEISATLEQFLAGLDSQFRTSVRRAENRLSRCASLRIVEAGPADVLPLMQVLFQLHAARWEERDNPGMLSTAALQAFHREAALRFERAGVLRLYGLMAEERCIAVQYNLAAKGKVYAYLSGFDPEWARYSPGAVLLKHSIERAIEEGALEFDFLRKPEPFKYQWGARDRINSRLMFSRAAHAEVG